MFSGIESETVMLLLPSHVTLSKSSRLSCNLSVYTTVYNFRVTIFFLKEMNMFLQQGCIKVTKSHSKNIYNVPEDFYFI